jgi:hypothetical protein
VEQFPVASAEGPGRRAVTWEVERGGWSLVAMNAHGARRVLDADVAAKVGGSWASGSDCSPRLLLVAGGIVLIGVAARRGSRPANQE